MLIFTLKTLVLFYSVFWEEGFTYIYLVMCQTLISFCHPLRNLNIDISKRAENLFFSLMKIFVILYLKIPLFLGNHKTQWIAEVLKNVKRLKDVLLMQRKGHLYQQSLIAVLT